MMTELGFAALTEPPVQSLKVGKQFERPLHFFGERFSLHGVFLAN